MNAGKYSGVVSAIGRVQTYGKGFKKCEVVFKEESERFTNWVAVEFVKDHAEQIDFDVGDTVGVNYELRGRQWEKDGQTRYFISAEVRSWKVLERAAPRVEQEEDVPF